MKNELYGTDNHSYVEQEELFDSLEELIENQVYYDEISEDEGLTYWVYKPMDITPKQETKFVEWVANYLYEICGEELGGFMNGDEEKFIDNAKKQLNDVVVSLVKEFPYRNYQAVKEKKISVKTLKSKYGVKFPQEDPETTLSGIIAIVTDRRTRDIKQRIDDALNVLNKLKEEV